ncbi:MAG: sodium-dependent bicarbonate transport family permease [Gemmatimonadales bacterium]|nr:MAG: sodium-dependent bicarbonate transport family permease [Gemmatimonadales bacterium]
MENLLDPVILFFVLGLVAGVSGSDLRLPESLYETLSIYLLASIGLKGGVELANGDPGGMILPLLASIGLGMLIPPIAFAVLRASKRFGRADAAAIAAHYGSVSVVTFAVAITFLDRLEVPYEEYVTTLLVIMEIPGIAVGVVIARLGKEKGGLALGRLAHEVFFGKSILLLVGGMAVGYLVGPDRLGGVEILFFDLFRGALAFFLLEMGIVTARRLADLRSVGAFLVAFGIAMPLFSGFLGVLAGALVGLSVGGTTILATLAASASYIAATAAMRVAVPEANPTLYLTASLGVTFPFNIVVGIPVYYHMALWILGAVG